MSRTAKAPQQGGYVKLWRSMADNGHLRMPEVPFKLFVYLILQTNRAPAHGCDIGEGWITYRMIKEACSKPEKPWADSTISRALAYLEGNNHDGKNGQPEVYITRLGKKCGGPQRIKVLNYRKYQDALDTSSETLEVVGKSSSVTLEVSEGTSCTTLDKQEEKNKEKKKGGADMRELTDEMRDNWLRAYQVLFVGVPSSTWISAYQQLQEQAGVTDRLIVAVIERAVRQKRRNPLRWAYTVLQGLVPYEITTVEQWNQFEAEQAADDRNERENQEKVKRTKDKPPVSRTYVDAPSEVAMLRKRLREEGELGPVQ